MKNVKFLFFMLISILFIFPNITNAETITNNNGVVISEQEYNNFLKIYSSEYIMNMSEEKYNKIKDLNFDDITTTNKYVETVYNQSLQLTTERELTEEEFENYNPVMTLLDNGAAHYESTAKLIEMTVVGGTTWNYVFVGLTWKGIPSTRSFDVIGIRGYGFEFRDGSQTGEQIYKLNGSYTSISYAWNGTNIKKHDNGFGISMNIVNSDITTLQATVECDVKPTITHPTVYTSYQHAVATVTLAQSQNYTLGGAGLGGVFVFPYSISQKYDGMSGIAVEY